MGSELQTLLSAERVDAAGAAEALKKSSFKSVSWASMIAGRMKVFSMGQWSEVRTLCEFGLCKRERETEREREIYIVFAGVILNVGWPIAASFIRFQ